jgi:hypothetical protein
MPALVSHVLQPEPFVLPAGLLCPSYLLWRMWMLEPTIPRVFRYWYC